MNKAFKITAWVLAILGIVFAILCLNNENNTDLLLRYTYILFFGALLVWIGLAIFMTGRNNPKGLLKAAIFLVAAAVLVVVVYMLANGSPAVNVKTETPASLLKLTDTLLILTAVLGIGAVLAICVGVVKNSLTKK